jgi:hypothetical protein
MRVNLALLRTARSAMPFDMYAEVIRPRDITEHGLHAAICVRSWSGTARPA